MSLESRLRHVEILAAAAASEAPTEGDLDQMLGILTDEEEPPPDYKIPLPWIRWILERASERLIRRAVGHRRRAVTNHHIWRRHLIGRRSPFSSGELSIERRAGQAQQARRPPLVTASHVERAMDVTKVHRPKLRSSSSA